MSERKASSSDAKPTWLPWLGVAAATTVTIVFAVWLVRAIPRMARVQAQDAAARQVRERDREPGIVATLTAGDVTVSRHLPAAAFRIEPGQSLDPRLPAGPFEAVIEANFQPRDTVVAFVGAEIQNGSLVVRREGQTILTDYAGEESRVALTTTPLTLSTRLQSFEFRFKSDGGGVSRFRAVWQPEFSPAPLPLPVDDARWMDSPGARGLAEVQRFNCAACHRSSDPALQALLHPAPAPDLTNVGARVRPDWLRKWLINPESVNADALMPQLFHGLPDNAAEIDALTHFFASRGGPLKEPVGASDADENLLRTGRLLYERVGCVACHGPTELIGGAASVPGLFGEYQSIPRMAEKTTVDALAAYLQDPVSVHPSGMMPSMMLDEIEAKALATFLINQGKVAGELSATNPFSPVAAKIERGRAVFAQRGCAACHELRIDDVRIESARSAPPLESISASLAGEGKQMPNCIAPAEGFPGPHFALPPSTGEAIIDYLKGLSDAQCHDVPLDRLGAAMRRLNCLACHEFHDGGGAEPLIARMFAVTDEVDLGDEGRVPPDLSHAGGRLQGQWMRRVLEDGGRARPYMATRMPQFGADNVAAISDQLLAAAGAGEIDRGIPEFTIEDASNGRTLVGQIGLGCIQCHAIAGQPATGTPGPDLVQMVERLRYEHFLAWVAQPQLVRPGTRMPTFYFDGYSGLTNIEGGDAVRQIPAIWAYLSQGENLSLPEGIVPPESYDLSVGDQPIVFRTFMHDAGVRAIACGFPEGVHCAFDANRCRIAAVWTGEFLNASGAWAQRGGSETNPEGVAWIAPEVRIVNLNESDDAAVETRFRGYEFDEQRRPVFRYELVNGDMRVLVREQPIPVVNEDSSAMRLVIQCEGPPRTLLVISDPVIAERQRELILDDSGRAETEVLITW